MPLTQTPHPCDRQAAPSLRRRHRVGPARAGRASGAAGAARPDRPARVRARLAALLDLAAQGVRLRRRRRRRPRRAAPAVARRARGAARRAGRARRRHAPRAQRPDLRRGAEPPPDRGDAARAREAQVGARLARGHRRARLQALARAPAVRAARDAAELVAGGRLLRLPVSRLTPGLGRSRREGRPPGRPPRRGRGGPAPPRPSAQVVGAEVGGVVEDRDPPLSRLGVADRAADHRLEDLLAEALLELLQRLAGMDRGAGRRC